MNFEPTLDYATELDAGDPLAPHRAQFYLPEIQPDKPAIYFLGHSLGLQPKSVPAAIQFELDQWAKYGAQAHFEQEGAPWVSYHQTVTKTLSVLSGAKESEVVAMNSLTVNMHLLLVSFYQPTAQRFKILVEDDIFSSDWYALVSHIRYHGFDPNQALLKVSSETILSTIAEQGEQIALVWLGAVNYLSGYFFDLASITQAAHAQGCMVGADCAHAIGNVPLALHDWQVDFAVWCNYKYLNGGPGCIGGAFIHHRHHHKLDIPRFNGWWGHDLSTRFTMPLEFVPMADAQAWQVSNPPIFPLAALRASLDIFDQAGLPALRQKSLQLTAYLEYLLAENVSKVISVLTSKEPLRRGAQLSIKIKKGAADLAKKLLAQGVYCDVRSPDIIRIAPVPLYNTFTEVFHFVHILKNSVKE